MLGSTASFSLGVGKTRTQAPLLLLLSLFLIVLFHLLHRPVRSSYRACFYSIRKPSSKLIMSLNWKEAEFSHPKSMCHKQAHFPLPVHVQVILWTNSSGLCTHNLLHFTVLRSRSLWTSMLSLATVVSGYYTMVPRNLVSLHPWVSQCNVATLPIHWWGLLLPLPESGLALGFALTYRMWQKSGCIICNRQKMETTQVSMDRWMDEQNVIYTYKEYYSALKRKEILTHTTSWMSLEDMMLSEINPSQKVIYCMMQLL